MNYSPKSIRTFIGAKDFKESRAFYAELGFTEVQLSPKMVLIKVNETLSFYLQDYYVKDWVNNSMIFLEVDHLEKCWEDINNKRLAKKYKMVKFSKIKKEDWGSEFFLHDPSGVLWHFGKFI